ncbi:hypothetical protein BU24DRAFT_8388 [Aaosphaeria arxii CBS 175.79]|uniref:UBC core domain-containing protein n=1 Tax=Aaosphaeria arxii CBS 175.79 TaxID=1450172 RepID=A0A6A5Y5E8_9PLEO|nr:uncharacterized protein BU24DRAFT_8388 [Aaosphaeria arxii CBS 175.79]KAF2020785.1 hypothetical protein BU24DRAFT_8388 [Aaosphaeria arxii CBS 175.79]
MPRKQFVADLCKAVEGVSVAGISNVRHGDDDGEFKFMCLANGGNFEVSVLIPELADYPSSHTCMIFAPDDAPAAVAGTLAEISDYASGKTVVQLLELVSRKLESTDRDGDTQMLNSQANDSDDFIDDSDNADFEEEEDEEEEDEYFPDDDTVPRPLIHVPDSGQEYTQPTSNFRNRIRDDLIVAKANGFKVGHLGGLMDGLGCYVSLSCRIAKLGISQEAMQAWQVEPSEYLVAILHYPSGYKSMDDIRSMGAFTSKRYFGVRVGISTSYKPTMQEAVRAFTRLSKEEERRNEESQAESQSQSPTKGFRNSFISRPLNELLEERFAVLLTYRYNGMSWGGAEEFYNDNIGMQIDHAELGLQDKYLANDSHGKFPSLVNADHITDSGGATHSLPLVAMQFVLRHFVRCTEFCLICFTKLSDDLQAIKPYVCDKPLCLYQYMSLGFGPSIEHEILSQPKVVDLLISFCYCSARYGKLKDFPTGLSLMVPSQQVQKKDNNTNPAQPYTAWNNLRANPPPPPAPPSPPELVEAIKARFNSKSQEIMFPFKSEKCPVRTGDWLALRLDSDPSDQMHVRVTETSYWPTIWVSEPIYPTTLSDQTNNSSQTPFKQNGPSRILNEFRPASFHIYNQNFDELDEFAKREAIYTLLDILPSVEEMRKYLTRKAQSPLSSWVERMPPAALGILRWIIASNRACIVQVMDQGDRTSGRREERLYGMSGWTQFRFAMGAPDKERRFLQAMRDTAARLNLTFPSLFAWHGSPLHNWHSIIREGLHFNDTAHGRAYGHGVYHSLDVRTSLGYSGYHTHVGSGSSGFWPQSGLQVSQAIALNEVVNAPKEFVSNSPHLVVAQLDWIQTRYLFVKSASDDQKKPPEPMKEVKPVDFIAQDPKMSPYGTSDSLIIPLHAVSGSRRPKAGAGKSMNKRLKTASGASPGTFFNPIDLDADDDDRGSVATLEEDLIILRDDGAEAVQEKGEALPIPSSLKGKSKAGSFLSKLVGSKSSKPLTDYVPGTLDYSSLVMLAEPAWATRGATNRLMKDFQQLLKVQAKELPHELGWHIDADKIENMYQWIVELHSFDPTLPLAKDMKAKGHKSVVLELRFGKDYPMSPPFVRVIRPRFLGFQQGGGGHVTAGGAMCMELLTNDGWSAVSSIESVLLQVRMAMSSLEPKPARLENHIRSDYGVAEAVDAYIRACQVHGWTVPEGFREMALGGLPRNQAQQY